LGAELLFLSDFNKKNLDVLVNHYSNTKFHKNPSIGSRVVPRGRTGGQTEMTNLIVCFRNFAKPPKIKGAWGSVVVKALAY